MPTLKCHSCGPSSHAQVGDMYSAVAAYFNSRVEAAHVTQRVRSSFVHCLGVDKAAIHLLIRRQLNRNIASQTRRDLTGCGPNLSRVSGPCVPMPNNKFH